MLFTLGFCEVRPAGRAEAGGVTGSTLCLPNQVPKSDGVTISGQAFHKRFTETPPEGNSEGTMRSPAERATRPASRQVHLPGKVNGLREEIARGASLARVPRGQGVDETVLEDDRQGLLDGIQQLPRIGDRI